MRPGLVGAALLTTAAMCTLDAAARAQSPTTGPRSIAVDWEAPAECPSRDELQARLARLLAGSERKEAVRARVAVMRRRSGAWSATIVTNLPGVTGERTLSADSCDLLASATALVIALAFDPDLNLPTPPAPTPPAPPAPLSPRPEATSVEPSPAEGSPPWRLVAEAWAAGDGGALPSIAPGAGLALGAEHAPWSAQAYAEAWAAASATSSTRAGAGGHFQLFDAGLRACVGSWGWLGYGACAGAEVDAEQATGFGVSAPGSAARAWISPRGGLALTVRLTEGVRLPLRIEALVPLGAPSFALENVGTIFRPAPVGVRASLGVSARF